MSTFAYPLHATPTAPLPRSLLPLPLLLVLIICLYSYRDLILKLSCVLFSLSVLHSLARQRKLSINLPAMFSFLHRFILLSHSPLHSRHLIHHLICSPSCLDLSHLRHPSVMHLYISAILSLILFVFVCSNEKKKEILKIQK